METIEIELTRLFVKVIQQGSFSRAAELLKVPKSTVSKGISRLEQVTGTKLLLRTTRSQTLTAAGRAFYEACLEPIQVLEDAQRSLFGQDTIVSGRIRLTAPEDLGNFVVAPAVGELCRQHPQLSFDLHFTSQRIDLIKEGFDLAIRIGKLPENRLRAKRIGDVVLVLVASSQYLKGKPRLRRPLDLREHDCLTIGSASLNKNWRLKRDGGGSGETAQLDITPKVEANQMTSVLEIARTGGGIALVPSYLCARDVASGELVRVLPDWIGVGLPVSLVSPVSIAGTARLKLVSEHLVAALTQALAGGRT